MKLTITLILLISMIISCESCKLSGKEIGVCSENPMNNSNFCYEDISSYICIPAFNVPLDLSDNLVRIRLFLQRWNSLIAVNEIFATTTSI